MLRRNDQALLDAIAPGDRKTWERLLTPDAVYVDENGVTTSHDEFLKGLAPLPAGSSGHIAILDYDVKFHGNVALVVHRDDEREDYHGVPLHADYLMTETWIKLAAGWRLAMVHAYVVAKDPPPITLPSGSLDEYVGRYQAAPDLVYEIRREGDHLSGATLGGEPRRLSAELPDVMFISGRPRERKIFRRGANRQIIDFVDRREGEDLVFVRVNRPAL